MNGLRACARKGFLEFLERSAIDVLCLQEVRAFPEQLEPPIRAPAGWHTYFQPAERPGYSGVAIYSRQPATRISSSLGEARFDVEGRFLVAHFDRLAVASVYFPKGSGRDRDNSRVPYKLDFYAAVLDAAQRLRRRGPTFITGDFNTTHTEIDLARPQSNRRASGFLPEERAVIDHWLALGWVDSFRVRHPDEPGHYSWWRQVGDARAKNVGWRIDYVLASPSADARVAEAFLWPDTTGSDHCPVGVKLGG